MLAEIINDCLHVGYLGVDSILKHPPSLSLSVDYKFAGRMGEGTFSEVLKCQSLLDGKMYACKRMKQKYDR